MADNIIYHFSPKMQVAIFKVEYELKRKEEYFSE